MGFFLGQRYELKEQWKQYFDMQQGVLPKHRFIGYYYANPIRFPESAPNTIAFCRMLNDKGESNPLYSTTLALIDFDWVISAEMSIYLISCGARSYESYEKSFSPLTGEDDLRNAISVIAFSTIES